MPKSENSDVKLSQTPRCDDWEESLAFLLNELTGLVRDLREKIRKEEENKRA